MQRVFYEGSGEVPTVKSRPIILVTPSSSLFTIKTALIREKIDVPLDVLTKAFSRPEKNFNYNIAFLPKSNGFGLLSRPEIMKVKK